MLSSEVPKGAIIRAGRWKLLEGISLEKVFFVSVESMEGLCLGMDSVDV